jgi:hypothetical protein
MRFIGMDVHRDFCEVAIWEAGEDQVAMEMSGNAAAIARIIEPHVASVAPADPKKVRERVGAKTDRLDARVLARLGGFLVAIWIPDDQRRARHQVGRPDRIFGGGDDELDHRRPRRFWAQRERGSHRTFGCHRDCRSGQRCSEQESQIPARVRTSIARALVEGQLVERPRARPRALTAILAAVHNPELYARTITSPLCGSSAQGSSVMRA